MERVTAMYNNTDNPYDYESCQWFLDEPNQSYQLAIHNDVTDRLDNYDSRPFDEANLSHPLPLVFLEEYRAHTAMARATTMYNNTDTLYSYESLPSYEPIHSQPLVLSPFSNFPRHDHSLVVQRYQTEWRTWGHYGKDLFFQLPDEILGMIFQWAADFCGEPDTIVEEERAMQPFRCAGVCRRWRSTAVGTPSLWTYIVAPRSISGLHCAEHWRYRAEVCIARSGVCPLQISVEIGKHDECYGNILDTIFAQHLRWGSLVIEAGYRWEALLERATLALTKPTPLLETISISCSRYHEYEVPENSLDYLPHAPRLRYAHFEYFPIAFNPRRPVLLSASDVGLHHHPCELAVMRDDLASFSALSKLTLYWDGVLGHGDSGLPIAIPTLQILVVQKSPQWTRPGCGWGYSPEALSLVPILEVLHVPNLTELEADADYLPLMDGFICRCAHTLRSLRLSNGPILDVGTASTLAACCKLEEISFDDCEFSKLSLDALCADSGTSWPHLRRAVLRYLRLCDIRRLLLFLSERRSPPNDLDCEPPAIEIEGCDEILDGSYTPELLASFINAYDILIGDAAE